MVVSKYKVPLPLLPLSYYIKNSGIKPYTICTRPVKTTNLTLRNKIVRICDLYEVNIKVEPVGYVEA